MVTRTLLALDETSFIPAEVRFQSQGSNLPSMLEISQMSTCCFLKYIPDLAYVDMEQLGIPQCISPASRSSSNGKVLYVLQRRWGSAQDHVCEPEESVHFGVNGGFQMHLVTY